MGGLFPIEPLEIQCLKRIHAVACAAEAYLSIGGPKEEEGNEAKLDPISECAIVVTISREFNANVSIVGICNLPDDPKLIVESISALWGIVLILFQHSYAESLTADKDVLSSGTTSDTTTGSIGVESGRKLFHSTLVPFLQTLYQ